MILVTGGTGLVGSQLLFDLASTGKKIRALKRKESSMVVFEGIFSKDPSLKNHIEWVDGDIIDPFSLDDAMKGVDTIYHSAAFISFYPSDVNKMLKINIDGTANMIDMALKNKVSRFCHVSSVAALGRISGEEYVDENSWWKTSKKNSNYAISKYGAEREVWRGMEEGLSAFIINPTIILGPGDWKNGSTILFSQVWNGLKFYTTGVTGFVDVRDVSKSAIALMEKGIRDQRYVINSENVSYRYVVDCISECFGKKKPAFKVNSLMIEAGWRGDALISKLFSKKPLVTKETGRNSLMHWNYSNEKIRNEIGIEFIPIKKSIEDTCEIFLVEKGVNRPKKIHGPVIVEPV